MPQQEQSGVPKAKATRKAPLSVAATSEAAFINFRKMESWVNFSRTAENRIWSIYTNQLTIFHDRFHGNVPHRDQLKVRLISDKVHSEVQFRKTPYTTENNNLLSTLDLTFSSSIDRQVSRLFKLLIETGRTESSIVVPLLCRDTRGERWRRRALGETLLFPLFLPQTHRLLTTNQKVQEITCVNSYLQNHL